MNQIRIFQMFLCFFILFSLVAFVQADGKFFEVEFAPSQTPGELIYASKWRIWIPDGVETLRGVIVHQHGCGDGSAIPGHTAVEDWHWQSLARKYDCSLMAVSYAQKGPCEMWCNPKNGSAKCFLNALEYFAKETNHAELTSIPWALWGHSGGGQWVSSMTHLFPTRVLCTWARSGHPNTVGNTLDQFEFTEALNEVPYILNLGVREKTEFKKIWDEGFPYVQKLRQAGAKASIFLDPNTGHCCGDSRYAAIQFFDVCMAQRLPKKAGSAEIRPMQTGLVMGAEEIWEEFRKGEKIREITQEKEGTEVVGSKLRPFLQEGFWLPTEDFRKTLDLYQCTGMIEDLTPPPAPFNIQTNWKDGENGSKIAEITWNVYADVESGLAAFIIERNGTEIARLNGERHSVAHPVFQGLLYSDTPAVPTSELKFTETIQPDGKLPVYTVRSVNVCGVKSL